MADIPVERCVCTAAGKGESEGMRILLALPMPLSLGEQLCRVMIDMSPIHRANFLPD